jgi:hypothetical protein
MDPTNQHRDAWISLGLVVDYVICVFMAFGSLNRSEINIVQIVVVFIPVRFPSKLLLPFPTPSSPHTNHLTQSVQFSSTRPEADAVARPGGSTHVFELRTHMRELLLGKRVGTGMYICVS